MSKGLFAQAASALKALSTRRIHTESDSIPFVIEGASLKKILNWILVEASIPLKPSVPWGWPTHLQVEPTTLCNLRCALCPVTSGLSRSSPPGHMDPQLFKNLIDQVGDYLMLILLWDWGEPFLNPHVYDIIAYAKQRNIAVVSSTNGHPFAHRENARKLVHSGIDSLIVAVDGVTQEVYQQYRQGGDLATVLTGLRNLVAEKKAARAQNPLINLRLVVMRHNEHQVQELLQLGQDLGVDVVSLKTVNPHFECSSDDLSLEVRESFLPQTVTYQRFKYEENGTSRIQRNPPCKNLWNNPAIHADGTICACTFDHDELYAMGNLWQSSFKDIWGGRSYKQIRQQFRRDWRQLEICRDCTFAYEGGGYDERVNEVYVAPWAMDRFAQSEHAERVRELGDRH